MVEDGCGEGMIRLWIVTRSNATFAPGKYRLLKVCLGRCSYLCLGPGQARGLLYADAVRTLVVAAAAGGSGNRLADITGAPEGCALRIVSKEGT